MEIFHDFLKKISTSDLIFHSESFRKKNTTVYGTSFKSETVDAVWKKAEREFGYYFFRKDLYGTSIGFHDFGRKNEYGWEIDHIIPVSKGGTDDLFNLQPLHWKNNLAKGDDLVF